MLFCGVAFCKMLHSMDTTTTNPKDITGLRLQNGVYDEFYLTADGAQPYTTTIPSQWDYNTLLYAHFNGDLMAGNINFVLEQVTSVLIKRRESGTNDWVNILQKPISTIDDFKFITEDKYARAGVNYDYALVPVINTTEGSLNIQSITPEFEGIFIMEKDTSYHSVANISMSTTKNRPSAIINTIDSPYPYVVTNGENNYYTGSTSAMFVRTDKDMYDWQFYDSWKYRDDLMEFLCNGEPKILKHFDGRMYLISVVDNPSQDEGVSNFYPQTTFNWVEIGDADNQLDLYNNNLTDYNGSVAGGV